MAKKKRTQYLRVAGVMVFLPLLWSTPVFNISVEFNTLAIMESTTTRITAQPFAFERRTVHGTK